MSREEFEFVDGLRTYRLGGSDGESVYPARAVDLLERAVLGDHVRRSRLIAWYQRRFFTAPKLGSDATIIADLLRRVQTGWIRMRSERRVETLLSHTQVPVVSESDYQPVVVVAEPAPIMDDERSLMIVRCEPTLGPGPLKFTYLMRGIAGRPAVLRISAESYPGGVVHEQSLGPSETTDGPHDSEWDGVVTSGGDLRGKRLSPAYSPAKVEVIHDSTYKDAASFTIPHRRATILQFEDLSFATDRSILLPNVRISIDDHDQHPRDKIGGLEVIATALRFAERNAHKLVLVAGHTDTAGSVEHNRVLSEQRAHNVEAYLRGDRAGWAQLCQDNYEISDFKAVHLWAMLEFGWNTDPGELDNEWTSQARTARDEFRLQCNGLLRLELAHHVKQNRADWEAIFQLYDIALARRLDCDAEQLAKLRGYLNFIDPPVLGCGEHWPVEAIGVDDHALADNRRAELVFFDPGEEPQLPGDPPGVELYGHQRYRAEYLPADPTSYEGSRDYEVWVELRDHWLHAVAANENYTLRGPIPAQPTTRLGTLDGAGRLRETELPPGDYLIEVGDGFAVVGARYGKICYLDDTPDVYRLQGWQKDGPAPDRPRIYEDPWVLIASAGVEFSEDVDDPRELEREDSDDG